MTDLTGGSDQMFSPFPPMKEEGGNQASFPKRTSQNREHNFFRKTSRGRGPYDPPPAPKGEEMHFFFLGIDSEGVGLSRPLPSHKLKTT